MGSKGQSHKSKAALIRRELCFKVGLVQGENLFARPVQGFKVVGTAH